MREFNIHVLSLFLFFTITTIPSFTVFIYSAAGSSLSFSWTPVCHPLRAKVRKILSLEVKLRLNFRRAAVVFQAGASFSKNIPQKPNYAINRERAIRAQSCYENDGALKLPEQFLMNVKGKKTRLIQTRIKRTIKEKLNARIGKQSGLNVFVYIYL